MEDSEDSKEGVCRLFTGTTTTCIKGRNTLLFISPNLELPFASSPSCRGEGVNKLIDEN